VYLMSEYLNLATWLGLTEREKCDKQGHREIKGGVAIFPFLFLHDISWKLVVWVWNQMKYGLK
jgi:hypothetical protein